MVSWRHLKDRRSGWTRGAKKSMPNLFIFSAICLAAYLVGAIPFGYLAGRLRGIDIRTVGSRNIGATNVMRTLGRPLGLATLLLDAAKGYCGAVFIPQLVLLLLDGGDAPLPGDWSLAGGVCAVVGHTWPVYLGFRGGKGVATSAGMLLGLAPLAAGLALAAFAVVLAFSGYVSLGSITAAVVLAVSIWFKPFLPAGASNLLAPVLSLLAVLVIVRHRANIGRLLNGTERRIAFRGGGHRPGKGNS